jgi:hypothetical protein
MNDRTITLLTPDGCYEIGVFFENGKLFAGYISNSGVNKEWSIDYDEDFSFMQNLEALYDEINNKYLSEDLTIYTMDDKTLEEWLNT